MNNLPQILAQAQANDLGVRRQALEYLENEGKANPGGLFISFSRVLAEGADQGVRIQAALYIKSKIKYHWEQICLFDQKVIKEYCLSSLATADSKVVTMGASAVSALICLELLKGRWFEVMDVLINNANCENTRYKFAAMLTLGCVCEEIDVECLSESTRNRILDVIVKNLICGEVGIVEQALKIMKFAVSCFVRNLEKENEGEWILRAVYDSFPSSPYLCLQVLCEIMSQCPLAFSSNLATLGTLTYAAINSPDEKISLVGIEVWNTVGDIEENRQIFKDPPLNYLKTACKTLTSLILPKLFMELMEDEWTCSKSAYSTIASMAQVCPGDNFPEIFDFIKQNLSDFNNKQAIQGGLLALTAVFEANVGEKGEVFEEFFPVCIQFLDSSGPEVDLALKAGEKLVLNSKLKLKKEFLHEITNKLKKIVSKIGKNLASAGSFLSSLIKRYKLSMDLNEIQTTIRFLLDLINPRSHQPSTSEARIVLSVLTRIFEEIPDQFSLIFSIFYPEIFNIYMQSLENQQETLIYKKSQILQIICACLPMNKISEDDLKVLVNKTISIGIEKMKIVEESLQLLGALAINAGCVFIKFYSQVSPYVLHYLSQVDSVDTLKSAILTAGDLARALGPNFIESVHYYLPHLLTIMEDCNLPIQCKILTINCLGDIAGAIKAGFLNIMPRVLKYIDSAAGISLDLNFETQIGESLVELRECIVQFYVGLVQGLFDCGQHLVVRDRVGQLCEYLLMVVQEVYQPSENLHESVFMIILDMLNYYKDKQLGKKFLTYVSKFIGQGGTLSQNAKYILGLIEIS